ncbi:MAG: phosphatidate cytidylyltransferase [Lachnospiraceae bacterium]|nr:phosphatidate cytidylyltransferase [Lachnospiraceae bacterium]
MFKTRLLSGIILVVAAALTLYFGGIITLAVMMIISLIGANELLKIFQIEKSSMAVIVYCATILYYLMLFFGVGSWGFMFLIISMIFILGAYVFCYPKYNANQMMAAFFSLIYVSIMLSYIYQLRILQNGLEYVVLIFLAAWGTDTFAYCSGMLLGKHKMTPLLSPKKTVEGAVGGLIGSALLGALYGFFIAGHLRLDYNPIAIFPVICVVGGIVSMIGDLAASAIKRNFDIKDYGTLIPGHGGILDRFDSIIIIAPIVYLIIAMLTGTTL